MERREVYLDVLARNIASLPKGENFGFIQQDKSDCHVTPYVDICVKKDTVGDVV